MADKEFVYEHTVYFNETNAIGGVVYFSHYVKWQGIAREEFFMKVIPPWKDIMQLVASGNANMITVEEHSHFKRHAYFGDTIKIKLQTANVKKCSFDLVFRVYRNGGDESIYEGWQRLTFDDCRGNFIPIPDPIRELLLEYEDANGVYDQKFLRKDKVLQA